jgi:hypothetical protein
MPDKKSDRAMVAYEQAEYEMAVRLFEEENAPLSPGKKFYLALSYLETDQALTAADLLAEVVRSESEEFHLPARWYRGLALLANQDTAAAEAVFQEIAKEESAYQEKAREILSEL